jgi:hypothetical protein
LQTAVKRMRQNNDKIVLIQSLSSRRCAFRLGIATARPK